MSHRGRVEPRRTVQGLHVNFLPYIYSILFSILCPHPYRISFCRFESRLRQSRIDEYIWGGTIQIIHFQQIYIYIYICIVEKTIESFDKLRRALDKRGEHVILAINL